MPTGFPIRWKFDDQTKNFQRIRTGPKFGYLSWQWLSWIMKKDQVHIRHQFNAKEKRIGARSLPVDGYHTKSKTIYQFHGCRFHGHDCASGGPHPFKNNITPEQLLKETKEKTAYFLRLGYHVEEMWECQWYRKKSDPEINTFLESIKPKLCEKSCLSTSEMVKEIRMGKLFGMIECDISVPAHLRQKFSEMPPVFKNVEVSRQDIVPYMRKYAEDHKIMSKPRRLLIGSYFGEKILLSSELFQWYLSHGLEVTKIYQFVEYEGIACFKKFADAVSNARREGDKDPDKAIIAQTVKLIGNSSYWKTLVNVLKYRTTKYGNEHVARRCVNESTFRDMNELSDDLFELSMSKKSVTWNNCGHIGFFVYSYAKLRMLEFKFDFLDEFIEQWDFEYLEMDTDSAYLALSGPDLESVIKPAKRVQFYKDYNKWFPAKACDFHQGEFTRCQLEGKAFDETRPCCQERFRYDLRTPGLFKVESTGEAFAGLYSKTYFCRGDKSKVASKGLQQRHNSLGWNDFNNVLQTAQPGSGINRGFTCKNNSISTYEQSKKALSYFYPKRKVLADGVNTSPLDI